MAHVRVTIVPRVAPAPDTLRVPVDETELGCVRWRGPVGAPVVVALHGITANAWGFGTVAEHLDPPEQLEAQRTIAEVLGVALAV